MPSRSASVRMWTCVMLASVLHVRPVGVHGTACFEAGGGTSLGRLYESSPVSGPKLKE